MDQDFLNFCPPELKETVIKMRDLILDRALFKAYQNLSDENKGKMAQVFDSGTDEEKKGFLENYLGDLRNIMLEETQQLAQEIQSNTPQI